MKLHLIEKKQESSDVITLLFKSDQKLTYQAGQYLRYSLDHQNSDNRGTHRYFTIAAAPEESVIQITTKLASQNGSSFKTALSSLNVGDEIEAEEPRGDFIYPDPNQPAVFIAGGIGITPYRAILMDLAAKNLDPHLTLLYANRTEEIVFKELFDKYLKDHQNFKAVYVVEQPSSSWQGETGRITPEIIEKYIPDLKNNPPMIYISGPEPMVESFEEMIKGMGVPKEKLKTDYFPGYEG